ncbi:hypothetical protein AB0D10_13890 [Kitasatospora sp. NPDC048545]|uniref:hypothetical protein n=1 Tax=Kitasatospora sp. NPDC048545 TaxID=3157208 RepID=UPI0033E57FE3
MSCLRSQRQPAIGHQPAGRLVQGRGREQRPRHRLRHRQGAPACAPEQSTAKLSVSTGSVPGTVADYNLADPFANGPIYSWAGGSYATAAEFAQSVPQQGAHDLTADPHYDGNADTELPIGSNCQMGEGKANRSSLRVHVGTIGPRPTA